MAASFVKEVLAGFSAAVMAEPDPRARLRRAAQLGGAMLGEIVAGASVAPELGRAVRVHRSLPVAGTAAAEAGGPYGVVLHPSQPYGPGRRQLLDAYEPAALHRSRRGAPAAAAPVVFFVHGGIWATGDRFHFAPLAVRLCQQGLVVIVISYTLYPEAEAHTMASEVLRALSHSLAAAPRFGGDPSRLAVLGHSAGGHLGALAVMLLAQLRAEAEAAAAAAAVVRPQQRGQRPEQRAAAAGGAATASSSGGGGRPEGAAPPLLSLPRVQLFVGMSGIYDIGRHAEYEEARGVHAISTMGRACGGPGLWDDVSPAVVLARALAGAASAGGGGAGGGRGGGPGGGGPGEVGRGYYSAFALAGEAVPYRCGLDASPSGAAAEAAEAAGGEGGPGGGHDHRWRPHARHHFRPHQHQHHKRQQQPEPGAHQQQRSSAAAAAPPPPPPFEAARAAGDAGLEDALAILSRFSIAAAAPHIPPAVLMSSLGDHMVQLHEAQSFAMRLLQAGVPVKHLVYGVGANGAATRHNDFVFLWRPLSRPDGGGGGSGGGGRSGGGVAPAAAAGPGGGGKDGGGGADGDEGLEGLPPFARDLMLILAGRVRVRFLTSPPGLSKL
ncbi:hypothetical protein Rsub_10405 [Raphidocelis subcapitata]|uniref:protein-S-isoprenylcysteine alpha-carbonyl methylesterase n=1 Tax=Raphidocelis subcapitata TaxID=307507 RepID=A0A2V0PEV4_9CHLO|nr:hypothetical protein Rsub_10405 [Raphidocelis subcapitata]|eukprot:GBF97482.1 hypothetical protein Rsub_10405 [Raphidocelis subcapitata]